MYWTIAARIRTHRSHLHQLGGAQPGPADSGPGPQRDRARAAGDETLDKPHEENQTSCFFISQLAAPKIEQSSISLQR